MLPVVNKNSRIAQSPLNRGIEQFFDDEWFAPLRGSSWNAMPLSLWEAKDHVYLEADLPGMTAEEVDVSLDKNELIIRGERKCESKPNGYDTRSYGRFEQRVTLPTDIEADRVEAKLTNGVLRVSIPKSDRAKPKRISLKSE